MAQLAMNLSDLMPIDEMSRRYDFQGDREVTLKEAMKLMEELQKMDELERQLKRVRDPKDLETVDPAEVERLLGEQASRELERLQELTKKLEEAGYLERQGDRLELTARALRKIGDKALARHLHPPQARPLRPPRGGAAGARAATHRRRQALRVRRPLPARPAGDPHERGGAAWRRHSPAPDPRRLRGVPHRALHPGLPPWSCST
jgi:uncharacterized protein with von Willebrand factor type A (vWA) domain